MKIAFDIDDTILVPSVVHGFGMDTPNYDTIAVYKWFQAQGNEMILWSGSGTDWAEYAESISYNQANTKIRQRGADIISEVSE